MEALDIAREHHPDLILMDIQLPEVSGLEVTKWLKEDRFPQGHSRGGPWTAFAMKGDEGGRSAREAARRTSPSPSR